MRIILLMFSALSLSNTAEAAVPYPGKTLSAIYAEQRVQELPMQPDIPAELELEPFEVLVFEADLTEAAEKMQRE